MPARRVPVGEHGPHLDAEGRGQPVEHVQVDAPGPVVFEVVYRGLADAHELGQLDLGQAAFVPEGLDAEL